jgi:hypothetical protein
MKTKKLSKIRISRKVSVAIRKNASNVDYNGVPGRIRTDDPLLRRQPLYPLSYRDMQGV